MVVRQRFVRFSILILGPWFAVFVVRYFGPITFSGIGIELFTFLFFSIVFTFIAFVIGYYSANIASNLESSCFFYNQNVINNHSFGCVFYFVRAMLIVMAILYPIVSFIDFFIFKEATLFTIVEQREAEHLTGPRNSLVGAVGALLSGAPPVLLVMLNHAKFRNKLANRFLYFIIGLGFVSMFLSGGRNAFFISLVFIVLYNLLFLHKTKRSKSGSSFGKLFMYFFVFLCVFFSMKMFLDRFEVQGFEVSFMLDYLEREYNIQIFRPGFESHVFISIYSVFVYLCFYISHALTYLNEYFVISYSPYLGGSYNLPQLARLVDVFFGTEFFSVGREKMLLSGVYLTLPGSLFIDFGVFGSLVVCFILGFSYGRLSRQYLYLKLFQRLILAYISTAFVFSPIYGIFGMANGFSLIFILIFVIFCSFRLRR